MDKHEEILIRAKNNWIPVTDHYPKEGQKVIYYFKITGIDRGVFYFATPQVIGGFEEKFRCFGGDRGYLCEDVTHWMPDEGQDLDKLNKPK